MVLYLNTDESTFYVHLEKRDYANDHHEIQIETRHRHSVRV